MVECSLNGDSDEHDVVDDDLPTVTVRHSNPEHDEVRGRARGSADLRICGLVGGLLVLLILDF